MRVEERALETEEHLSFLILAHSSSQAEVAEVESRLRSESAAKREKQVQAELLASQTADLNSRMLVQSGQYNLLVSTLDRLRTAAANTAERVIDSVHASAASVLPAADRSNELLLQHMRQQHQQQLVQQSEQLEAYRRQTVTLQRQQQVVDQLTAILQHTQQTLQDVVQAKAFAALPSPSLLDAAWQQRHSPPAKASSVPPADDSQFTAPPPKASAVRVSDDALRSFDARPPWSTSQATSYDAATVIERPPTLVVRRAYTLLPQSRHSLDIEESDAIPATFLEPVPAAIEQAGVAAALNMGRQAPKLQWKVVMPNLLGSSADWEVWITALLKESRSNAPLSHQPHAVRWLGKSFEFLR